MAGAELTEKDRHLIRNAEVGYDRASQLLRWWQERERAGDLQKFDVATGALKLNCFYDRAEIDGSAISAMACVWKSRFRSSAGPGASNTSLSTFVQREFMKRCRWTHPDKLPGGFEFRGLQYKLKESGQYGVMPDPAVPPPLDEIGSTYEWVVMEAVVYDFFRNLPGMTFGPGMLRRFPKMSSYILVHGDYAGSYLPPVEGAVEEYRFGYSFLPCPVVKSVFGHGPGKFAAAVKQFRFVLLASGELEVQLFFLVAPRSEKILSLAGFDPVYFSINIADALTFRRLRLSRRAHDRIDSFLLELHARVYQSLLEGMKEIWETHQWRPAAPQGNGGQMAVARGDG